MTRKPIRILIVDDSQVARDLLAHLISSDPDLKVVGFAKDGESAIQWLQNNTVDVITMDFLMPGADGLEVTRRIMATKPVPIIVVTAAYSKKNTEQSFQAMQAGALAIFEKPTSFGDEVYRSQAREIIATIKTVAEVKLVTRHTHALSTPTTYAPEEGYQLLGQIEAIGVGASLGGPIAISTLLESLPSQFPVPLFIVQHIAPGFTEGLVQWLQSNSRIQVRLAVDGEIARPGACYIAPSGCHMEVRKGNLISLDTKAKDLLMPSVARLFKSMASTYEANAVGVLLTGMGSDGAMELLTMKSKGAYTIAQDEASCLMFGMPKQAIALGAACRVLPLEQIAPALIFLTGGARKESKII